MPGQKAGAEALPAPMNGAAAGTTWPSSQSPQAAPTPAPSALRRELLLRLRLQGPSSPDQLAASIGVSRSGVLQQLRALEAAELVSRQTVRHGVGRPRHLYDVTQAAQDLFPANYDGLATGLLAAVRTMGGEQLIEDLFAARRRQLGQRMQERLADRLGPEASLGDAVRELAVFQDEQGYLCRSRVADEAVAWLEQYNCAIHHVARETPAACAAELELFREVLGAHVVRESHIARGDRSCTYRIEARQAD